MTTLATRRTMKEDDQETSKSNGAHVLIIEDEQDLRDLLSYNLQKEGFRVSSVESGEEGLVQIGQDQPDLIVLDLMLPGVNGLDVCRTLKSKKETSTIPIVMVTAKSEESDIVVGLELGADDYITKPFSPRILLARIRAVLRRRQESQEIEVDDRTIELGDLVISPERHEVRIGEEQIELTATEFKLLHMLASRPGRVFTRQQIITTIHGGTAAVTDRSIDVQIVTLRRKLGERGKDIETVRGVGYRYHDG